MSEKENSAEVQPNLGGDSSSGQTDDKKNASAEQSGSGEKTGGQGDDAHDDSDKKDDVVLDDNQNGQGDDAHGDSEKKDEVVLEDNQNGGQGDDAQGDSEKTDEVVLEDNQNGQGDSHNGEDDVHTDDSEKKELSAESQNGDGDVPPPGDSDKHDLSAENQNGDGVEGPHGDSLHKTQNADSEESASTDHNNNVVILKTPRSVKGPRGGATVRSDVRTPVVYDLTNDDKVLAGSSFGNFFKADASSSSVVLFPSDNSSVSLEHIDHFLHRMPKDRPLKEYIDCDFKMEVSLVEQFIDDKDPSQGDELGKITYYCRVTIF